jgi:DNA invertase Pin-like site-specific DNA recombinase
MLQDMRAKHFEAIVVWKFDRLRRSTQHLLQVLDEMRHLAVELIATSQNIDTSSAMGKLFFTILAGIAELERELIIERTQEKLDTIRRRLRRKAITSTAEESGRLR